jgi:hypothetical protein
MDFKMDNCVECNRLIASDASRDLCDVCYTQYDLDLGLIEDAISIYNKTTPSDISEHTHQTIKRIEHILEHQKVLAGSVESESTCSKCNEKPALSHSKYCLACQLAMYKSLGDSANLAAQNPVQPHKRLDTSIQSLRSAMGQKRSRTGFNRIAPNPSVKGNRRS